MPETVVITREWLRRHTTIHGGWTAAQLKVFGVAWPPRAGWFAGLVGRTMTADEKREFETVAAQRAS